MICDLCTINVLQGSMFRTEPQSRILSKYAGFTVCEMCADAVAHSRRIHIDEPSLLTDGKFTTGERK